MELRQNKNIYPTDNRLSTLLIVDDEPNILSALTRLLRCEHYCLLTAESGAEALEILERQAVDLVITDMRMPVMDGVALLEQVVNRWPDTGRILFTGYADLSATVDAINHGNICRYLSKPWDDDELKQAIREVLAQYTAIHENRILADQVRQSRPVSSDG